MRLWLKYLAVSVALVVGGLYFAHPVVLRAVGNYFVREQPLQRVQAIVVLSGHMPFRAMEAAGLYHQGWGTEVWLTRAIAPIEEAALARLGLEVLGEHHYNEKVLEVLGVPQSAIRVLPEPIINTADEIRVIQHELERVGGDRVIIVTSKVHTRRVQATWSALVGGSPRAVVRYTRGDPSNPDAWWKNTQDVFAVTREILGMINLWAGFPLSPHRDTRTDARDPAHRSSLPAFLLALSLALVFTAVAMRVARPLGFVDFPNPRKIHLTPMPRLGGVAIYAGLLLTVISFLDGNSLVKIVGIIGGATLLITVGTLDDRGLIHSQLKLFGAMPLAAIFLPATGIRAYLFTPLAPNPIGPLSDIFITVLWVVGVTAAFNILDHVDGLCAGIAAIASAFFLFFSFLSGQVVVMLLAVAMLGAFLGFLFWNFNPAKIFMGDGGAMLLGFMVSTLGLSLHLPDVPLSTAWMIPVLVLAVPIFDTTLITISRFRQGLLPFGSPGKDHTAHRLMNLGFSHRSAVLILYVLGIFGGLTAVLISHLDPLLSYAIACCLALMAVGTIIYLEKHLVSRGDLACER